MIILQTMSSSGNNNIATHVPILDGTNYWEWESQMKGYLQSQGLWRVANGTVTRPADNQLVEQAKWDILDDMAQGALALRISPNCRNHIGATSAEMWTALETAYRQVGISRIYGDFKALVLFRLSGTQHPAAEMEHFNTSLQRLVANSIDLPNNIVRLMYLSSLPARWDHITAIYLQGKSDITEINSVGVCRAILAEFERTKTSNWHHPNAGISGLKRHGEHPYYKQGSAPTNQHKAEGNQPGPPTKRGHAMAVERPRRIRSVLTLLSTLPLLIPSHWQHRWSWNKPIQWSRSNCQGLPPRLRWLRLSQVESPTQKWFPLDRAPLEELLLALDQIPSKWNGNGSKNSRFVQLCRR